MNDEGLSRILITAKALGKAFPGAFVVEIFYELHCSGGGML